MRLQLCIGRWRVPRIVWIHGVYVPGFYAIFVGPVELRVGKAPPYPVPFFQILDR